jgi:hypothetical protein
VQTAVHLAPGGKVPQSLMQPSTQPSVDQDRSRDALGQGKVWALGFQAELHPRGVKTRGKTEGGRRDAAHRPGAGLSGEMVWWHWAKLFAPYKMYMSGPAPRRTGRARPSGAT